MGGPGSPGVFGDEHPRELLACRWNLTGHHASPHRLPPEGEHPVRPLACTIQLHRGVGDNLGRVDIIRLFEDDARAGPGPPVAGCSELHIAAHLPVDSVLVLVPAGLRLDKEQVERRRAGLLPKHNPPGALRLSRHEEHGGPQRLVFVLEGDALNAPPHRPAPTPAHVRRGVVDVLVASALRALARLPGHHDVSVGEDSGSRHMDVPPAARRLGNESLLGHLHALHLAFD
mmetsp:Transcript_34702/g.109597  ORF Transcript_34702/g.109597 Transcript_34702/m.109597 type:complete len:230 (+) Transcript_34702:638-1327(+)